MVASAFLSPSVLLWSMSSISRSFCKGIREGLVIRLGTQVANTDVSLELDFKVSATADALCLLMSPHTHGGCVPSPFPVGFSYLGDFSKDDPSVLSALSQGLHVSQEVFPLPDLLHHWIGRRVISVQGNRPSGSWEGWWGQGLPLLGRRSGSVASVSH